MKRIILYGIVAILFASTVYFVQKREALTQQRSRASTATSCDVTINITPPPVPPSATPTAPDVSCERRANIAIVIDRSQSMEQKEANGKTKLELAREAAIAFVTAIKESGSRDVGLTVVSFGAQGNDGSGFLPTENNSKLHAGLTHDYDVVINAVKDITSTSHMGSCLECGLRIASGQFQNGPGTKAIIVISDGQANRVWNGTGNNAKESAIAEANVGKNRNISYLVIGFGDQSRGQVDEKTLTSIATSGNYTYKPYAAAWTQGFFDFLPKFCTPVTP